MTREARRRSAASIEDEGAIAPPKAEWLPNGKRRKVTAQAARPIPIRWPTTKVERRDVLNTWFLVAAQIAETRADFAVLLALRKWIDIRDGTTTATNEMLARWAGGLSPTHVSRSISMLGGAGLCTVEIGYRPDDDAGRTRRTRTMRLAFPSEFPLGVTISEEPKHLAHGVQATRPMDTGKTAKVACARVAASAQRAQDYDRASSETQQNVAPNGYARAKAIDAEPIADPGTAASDADHHSPDAEHDGTARRPSGRAFVESPSVNVTESEI